MKLVILGGGVAGAVAAAHAVKNGIEKVVILEKEKNLGGFHQDIVFDGYHFDLGAFFFWMDHNILQTFPGVKDRLVYLEETTWLSLTEKNNLDLYPPTLKGYLKDWGVASFLFNATGMAMSRIKQKVSPSQFESLDEDLEAFLGGFYKKMGLRNYITRLYGMSPKDVSTYFSTKRLELLKKSLSTENIARKLAGFKFGELDRYPMMTSSYARPSNGFGEMYAYIENELRDRGVEVNCNTNIAKIDLENKQVILADGTIHAYDRLLSSIPLGILCKLSGTPFNMQLKYKPLCSLFYEADRKPIPEGYAIFNFTERGKWKRITIHSAYYGTDRGKHYFVVESLPDNTEMSQEEMASQLDRDFRDTFTNTSYEADVATAKLIGSKVIPNAYPIYGKDFDPTVIDRLKVDLGKSNAYLVGRQGEFDYANSSDVALSAIRTIDKIVATRQPALV